MRRTTGLAVTAAAIAAIVVATAGAGVIRGTPRNDVLRGTAKADVLIGAAGNDKLFGLAGNDLLNGGPGNDVLTGGPGADKFACGPGRDVAVVDARDRVAADCETVQGAPKPAISVAGDEVPDSASGNDASFEVTLSGPTPVRVTVAYATANGTATAGSDYTATAGTLVFAPGQTSKIVSVPITGDTTFEPNETFTLTLSNPVNATLGTATATATITNDDVQTATPGHYNGPIALGGTIDFDVSADGRSVSGMSFLIYLNCDNGAAGLIQIHYGGSTRINQDLSFDATGSNGGLSVALTGKFDNVANTGGGKVQVRITFDDGVSCGSDPSDWTATRK
jgi:hypothetical protein